LKKPLINNQIRVSEVRLIDAQGRQIGVVPTSKALEMAKEQGLDLIRVTDKVQPPICKIVDSGKYLYQLKKKEKKETTKAGEMKGIRLTFRISDHDSQTRMNQAKKFLDKGYKVRVELAMRGREKANMNFAQKKLEKFIQALQEQIPIKVEREIKKERRGLTTIIAKQ